MTIFSTLRSYAADPCRGPHYRLHRASVELALIKRRHPGSPLGYTDGVDRADTYVYIIHKEPVEADDGSGNCWFGYRFYLDNCIYYSYFWIWDDEALRAAHREILMAWRERMLGRLGWFWKRWYRIAAKFGRYNDGSYCWVRCIGDLVLHRYWNGCP